MKLRILWALLLVAAASLFAASSEYLSARKKFDSVQSDKLKPGSRVELTPRELNAYAAHEAPDGVRNTKIEINAQDVATGSALVDFAKVQRSRGSQPGWLMSMLLEGERPVSVTARIRSGGGKATVDVQRVQISGMEIEGRMLDFLIQNVLLPMYPDAAVGRPFELGHDVDRLEVRPAGVTIVIGG